MRHRSSLLLGIALFTGCMIRPYQGAEDTLRTRGAHDLQCPSPQLQIENIGGTSYEVKGCGAARTYTCNTDGSTCVVEGNALHPP